MADAAKLVEILVAIWIVEIFALLIVCVLLCLFPPRDPDSVARIPDFVPENWGGDRPQANPERDPAIERGIQDRRR